MRIRTRIFATYIALGVALIGATGAMLYDTVGDEARAGVQSRVDTGVRVVAAALEGWDGPPDAARLDARMDSLATAADGRVTVVDPQGRVLADSEFDGPALATLDNHAGRPEIRAAVRTGQGESVRYSRSVDEDLLYRAVRVRGGPWASSVVRMSVPLTRVSAAQAHARRELLTAVLAGLALTLIAGSLLARYLSGPIRELQGMARRLTEGDLSARARVRTGDELEDLAEGLNSAAAGLADQVARTRVEKEQLEAVVEGMAEGVIVTGPDGRIAMSNAALRRMFSPGGTIEGRTPIEALRNPEAADAIDQTTTPGQVVVREVRVSWPTERVLALHVTGLPAGRAVGVFHDVTERKRVEEMRRDFVANVSHELQTPLTTLAGYGEALAGSVSDPDRVGEIAEVVRRQSARMSALVRDLLDLSRLESEGFVPELEAVQVEPLVREVDEAWAARAREKDLSLETRVEPGLEIRADRRLLHQALENLVENAIQYVPQGREVRIEARRVPGGVELAVADTGDGIPREDQSRIFERFYRVEKGRARARGGTGLGLAIVKHVAEVHAGRVEVESAPGRGATFRITLPE
ncbi:MAG TPA: ATP-binding protein [Gemmatimonadota bacterium]|nr:ATP-binding protein [Gemmatimonadota bacterium]